jgi:hypothetical protein
MSSPTKNSPNNSKPKKHIGQRNTKFKIQKENRQNDLLKKGVYSKKGGYYPMFMIRHLGP